MPDPAPPEGWETYAEESLTHDPYLRQGTTKGEDDA
jgi:hypothetical protein